MKNSTDALVKATVLESSLSAKIEHYFADSIDNPDVLEELLKSKNTEGTRRAYRRDLMDFFTRMTGQQPTKDSILEFLHLDGHKATLVVTKYKVQLRESGLAPSTINRRLAAVKSLVVYGRKLGMCNYALDVESVPTQPYRDTSGISEAEFLQVINGCDRSSLEGKRNYALLLLLWGNALRRNEISTLDIGHFDPNNGTLEILGKGKQARTWIKLPKVTVQAIADWLIARGGNQENDQPLFISLDFHHSGHRLMGDGVYKIVRRLFKLAGVQKQMSPHKCRHSAITSVLEKSNGDIRKARQLSRHSSLNTLQIYDDNRNLHQLEMSELLMDGLG